MISVPNMDNKIWNFEYKVVDMLKEYSDTGKIVVDLDTEGPDLNEIGLLPLLDYMVDVYDIDPKKITIMTSNQIETNQKYTIDLHAPHLMEPCNNFISNNVFPKKTFDANFKTFGLFIGRLNKYRLELLAELHTKHKSKSLYTCHYDRIKEYHRPHCGITDLINDGREWNTIIECVQTLSECPFISDIVESFPILTPAHMNISKVYHNFFIDIVAESYSTGVAFLPSEKIWRPLLLNTPFIVQGPHNYIKNLQKLGFQSFDKWWNEGYSEDPAEYQVLEIKKIICEISDWSDRKVQRVYNDMKPILDNNFECMRNLTDKKFQQVFGYNNE